MHIEKYLQSKYLRTNQQTWDEWASVHMQGSLTYPIEEFKAGKVGQKPNIPDDIGSLEGKSVLHLQCHFGMDTLMWARQGAHITGVDFSKNAIQGARALNRELGLDAEFILSDVYDLPKILAREFDIIITYYGTVVWLQDLVCWADVIAWYLKPNGFFYMADAHPFVHMLEANPDEPRPYINYPYFTTGQAIGCQSNRGTYANPKAKTVNKMAYQWTHSLSDIINSLIDSGLMIEYLHEFPYTSHDMFHHKENSLMEQGADGWWRLKGELQLPLMFSLQARKQIHT